MLAPLSWLKEYVDITLPPKQLAERLTEIGLNTEKITKVGDDTILDIEITPNRPDLLSIIGIAREIAALEKKKATLPKIKFASEKIAVKNPLSLIIRTDSTINPRFTGIVVKNVTVKESPKWLKEKLENIGQRSINNIVDITNLVMFELGNPLHAFDYDQIAGHIMKVDTAKDGEIFESVDGINYHLPKGAIVIRDGEKIIDLCGIKGGKNSGTYAQTKNVFIRVPVEIPRLIRKTSQMLSLRSEASSIFERGVNRGGTIITLNRCVDLILQLAGGEVASNLYDLKKETFEPWNLTLDLARLENILGITVPSKRVIEILESLNLTPKLEGDIIQTTIPTYRNDLQIEEDLIEEVARIYGLNNFPKTLPVGEIPTQSIPYQIDYRTFEKVKTYLNGCGFSEIYTYSLVSEKDLQKIDINSEHVLRVDNPVSKEFEYLRPSLKGNLLKAFKENHANFSDIQLFELGKVYQGKTLEKTQEVYHLAGIANNKNFYEIKGLLERLFSDFGEKQEVTDVIEILPEGIYFEYNFSQFLEKINLEKIFIPIPKFPTISEDLSIVVNETVKTGTIIEMIKKQSSLIVEVSLLDVYKTSRTFHIVYQNPKQNLTKEEVSEIREKILKVLKEKYNAFLKS